MEKSLLSHFLIKKFGGYFRVTLEETPKVTLKVLSHFRVALSFRGLGFLEVSIF